VLHCSGEPGTLRLYCIT